MIGMSILHFYGRFIFQVPLYNNKASNEEIQFQTNPTEDVRFTCGRDPTRYFEFIFRDVKVTQATYRDGTCAYNGDSMIGQRILLNGMMVDVSPSAICGQLFTQH